jgi:hypothetical protein
MIRLQNILPNCILHMAGKFRVMGLNIIHDGEGRVIISDDSKVYSDANYSSASDVEFRINKIIKKKYGR